MLINFIRVILRIFYIFPIKKNKVVFQSYNGRLYTCSPKYIAEGIINTKRYDVYYALRKGSFNIPTSEIKRIRYRSIKHFYHLMTAGFVIFNSGGITSFLPYRKKQVIIQTWHGGYSFKVIGNAIFFDDNSKKKQKLAGDILTYFLSGSELASEQYSDVMSVDKSKFLNIGLPRNDILLHCSDNIKKKICDRFELNYSKKIVLYAPTYRDGPVKAMTDYNMEVIDEKGVVDSLNKRFGGEFVFLYKAHHDMVPTSISDSSINASDYSDIQELMCAADIIITDYSSCMADFALQKKYGFLFTPDIENYESVHPFSMQPDKWPYQIALNNKELLLNIVNFDTATGLSRIENFLKRIGNCDAGHATESLINVMDKHLADM